MLARLRQGGGGAVVPGGGSFSWGHLLDGRAVAPPAAAAAGGRLWLWVAAVRWWRVAAKGRAGRGEERHYGLGGDGAVVADHGLVGRPVLGEGLPGGVGLGGAVV